MPLSLSLDPEIAQALAPMAEAGFTPPPVGDIAGRRAVWEPITGAAGTAQPILADVPTCRRDADRTTTPDPHITPYALWSYDDSLTAWPALLGAATGGPGVPATAPSPPLSHGVPSPIGSGS